MWNLGLLGASVGGAAAGSYDLLETVDLASNQSSISFSNLSSTYGSTYKHLEFRMSVKSTSTAGDDQLLFTTDASNYTSHYLYTGGSVVESGNITSNVLAFIASSDASYNNEYQGVVTSVLDFADTGKYKSFRTLTGRHNRIYLQSSLSESVAAIDNLTFDCNTGNLVAGSYISIYGLKAGA